jgi:hypothetical protein
MRERATITEADILAEVIAPEDGDMTVEAAESILKWRFSSRAARRMRRLLDRHNQGVLTVEEEAQLERYRRVGLLLDLVQAKARLSLARSGC